MTPASPRARAALLVAELEHRIEGDLFAGLERREVHATVDELYRTKMRVREIVDDAELNARLRAADLAIDRALAAWGRAAHVREVRDVWALARKDFAGWEEEVVPGDVPALEPPPLPRTRVAVARTRGLLTNPRLAQIRIVNRGVEPLEGLFRHIEDTLEAATHALNVAFVHSIARAERMTPDEDAVERLQALVRWAESSFAGTRFLARHRARGQAAVARWQASLRRPDQGW
jgi:hypothetical protein